MSAPHGFEDDEFTRRLLRSRPPRAALDWAGAALGGTVTAARPLRGGTASAVHLLRVARAGGAVERAVCAATGDSDAFARAKPLYEQALAGAEASHKDLRLGYGYLLECHGRHWLRQAAEQYQRAIELDPDRDKPATS